MWFDGIRQPDTIYVASVSRGKDSTAMLRAIQIMEWPLDAIVSVDVWFDDETPAELPPMVAFKDEWDKKCLDYFGVPVTRLCAETTPDKKRNPIHPQNVERGINTHTKISSTETKTGSTDSEQSITEEETSVFRDSQAGESIGAIATLNEMSVRRLTYCDMFYRQLKPRKSSQDVQVEREERENIRLPDSTGELVQQQSQAGSDYRTIYAFPTPKSRWCNSMLKGRVLDKSGGFTGFRGVSREDLHGVKGNSKCFPVSAKNEALRQISFTI